MANSPDRETPEPKAPAAWKESGFAEVYAEHSRAIYYLALRLLGDPVLAEDATHDVFLKAYRKYGEFRGDAAVRTWLYRIAINHCRNVQQSWYQRNILTCADDSLWEVAPGKSDSPLRVLEVKELGQQIQRALEALPQEYRLLLLLIADDKMSYEDAAELTGQTADAVRGKLHRARRAFAAAFRKTF
jgi:RNA polymerase sigma-70 factor (ECF subfamily)